MSPIGGMMISSTRLLAMVAKAAPMTTPTAMSTTLPRMTNSLNSFHMPHLPRLRASGVLGDTVAERPVLFLDLDQVDKHVLHAHVKLPVQPLGKRFVKMLLRFERAPLVQRDLDEDHAVAPGDVEIIRVVDEPGLIMLGDDLEIILGRHLDGLHHRTVDGVADFSAEPRLPLHERNSYKRHGALLSSAC